MSFWERAFQPNAIASSLERRLLPPHFSIEKLGYSPLAIVPLIATIITSPFLLFSLFNRVTHTRRLFLATDTMGIEIMHDGRILRRLIQRSGHLKSSGSALYVVLFYS